MTDKIEVVAFDADDTLWENELYFQEFEHKFCDLLKHISHRQQSRRNCLRQR